MKIETIVNRELNVTVRVYKDNNGAIWFSGKDVATILEYADPDQAIRKNVDKEDISYIQCFIRNDFGTPSIRRGGGHPVIMAFINESGFYSLVLRSNKKEAKKFRRWVTSDVLPKIRKFGYYCYENRPRKEFEALIACLSTNKDKDTNYIVRAEDIEDIVYLANRIEEGFDIDKDISRLIAINMANAKFGCFDELRNAIINRMSNSQPLLTALIDNDAEVPNMRCDDE